MSISELHDLEPESERYAPMSFTWVSAFHLCY